MNFTKLLILTLLSSFLFACTKLVAPEKQNNIIQGAYFGQENKEEVLLTNSKGNIQYYKILDESGIFEFKLSDREMEEGPFYLIYTYDRKPSLNPEPPFIKAEINLKQSAYLPAILVFKPNFKLKEKTTSTISFDWNEAIFSKSNNAYFQIIAEYQKFFNGKQQIVTAQIPYRETTAIIALKDKLRSKPISLKALFKKECQIKWFLQLPYEYPEGLKINYASEPVNIDFCK